MGSASSINSSEHVLFEKFDENICNGRVFMTDYENIGSNISKILDNKSSKVYFNGEFNIIAGSENASHSAITSNLPIFKYTSLKKEVLTLSMLESMEKKIWKKFRNNNFVIYDVVFYIDLEGYVNCDIKIIPNILFDLCFERNYIDKNFFFRSSTKDVIHIKNKFLSILKNS